MMGVRRHLAAFAVVVGLLGGGAVTTSCTTSPNFEDPAVQQATFGFIVAALLGLISLESLTNPNYGDCFFCPLA